jgi:predicted Zn-dependent protease
MKIVTRFVVSVAVIASALLAAPAHADEYVPQHFTTTTVYVSADFPQARSGWGIGRAIRAWNAAQDSVTFTRSYTAGVGVIHVTRYSADDGWAGYAAPGTMPSDTYSPGGAWLYDNANVWLNEYGKPPGKLGAEYRCQRVNVVAHELGHAIGLPHSESASDLMYPVIYSNPRGCGVPSPDDVARLVALYAL